MAKDAVSDGQVTLTAAEVYEEFFIPALLGQWTPHVVDAARVEKGQRVLDVACGTGVLAREAAARVGSEALVTGLDLDAGMLTVARRRSRGVTWRQGRAESLPFADASFDAVVSQFGLTFFQDRVAALREMRRVLRPGGTMAVAVWASLEEAPGYRALGGLLRREVGARAGAENDAPFALGDPEVLIRLLEQASIAGADVQTLEGEAVFHSIEAWMHTEVRGWTLAGSVDRAQYGRLLEAARRDLSAFVQPGGVVRFPIWAHVVHAMR